MPEDTRMTDFSLAGLELERMVSLLAAAEECARKAGYDEAAYTLTKLIEDVQTPTAPPDDR